MIRTANAILYSNGRLLLGFRAAHKFAYPNCWDLIGGHIEPGETIQQALIREVQEEVGVTPLHFAPIAEIAEPHPALLGEASHHIFVVTDWTGGDPTMLGNEHTELRWFTVDEACALEELAFAAYPGLFAKLAK